MSEPLPLRAWRALREEGIRSVWFRSLAVLGFRRLYLLRRRLSEPIPACTASLPLTIDWLVPEHGDAYLAFRHGAPVDDVARRLRRGDRCLAAWHDGRLVGVMWGSTAQVRSPYLGREWPVAAGEAFQFDAYTSPAVRGMGIAPALSLAWLRHLRDEGLSAAIRLTLPENAAALRAHAKVGYQVTGIVRCIRLGPWRHDFPVQPLTLPGTPGEFLTTRRSSSRGGS
jgi:GNAT superfamily N-acetyltransferase